VRVVVVVGPSMDADKIRTAAVIHGKEKTYALLNDVLVALRSDRTDSVSVAERLGLIVKEWSKHTGERVDEPRLSNGVNGETARQRMRRRPNTKAVMSLATTERDEFERVHTLVAKLQASRRVCAGLSTLGPVDREVISVISRRAPAITSRS
jgi:hypothetical protein